MNRNFILISCQIILTTVALLVSPPTVSAQEDDFCFQIVSGLGAGVSIRVDAEGEASDLLRGIDGHLSQEENCDCLHFHGTLLGKPDPDPSGCGWGCVQQVPCPEFVRDLIEELVEEVDDLGLRLKLISLGEGMLDAIEGLCWSSTVGLRVAAFDSIEAGRARGVVPNAAFSPELYRRFGELQHYGLGHSMQINNEDTPQLPPAPVTEDCSLELYTVEGSGSNTVLRAVAKKVLLAIPGTVTFRAVGKPPGGTYTWFISPASETNKVTTTGTDLTYTSDTVVKKLKIQVDYACPDGKTVSQKRGITTYDNDQPID